MMLRIVLLAGLAFSTLAGAQPPTDWVTDLKRFAEASGVAGHEDEARQVLLSLLPDGLAPVVDEMGNVRVTLGDGDPHTVVITHYDEMGYVVSGITGEGFLRVSRMGNFPESPFYDLFHEGQLLQLVTPRQKLPAAVAVTSVHLRGERSERFTLEDMWIDVGASSKKEALEMGVDLLQPLHIFKEVRQVGPNRVAGPAVGERFGGLAMVEALRRLDQNRLAGRVTFVWTVQGTLLGRGYGAGALTGRGARRVAQELAEKEGPLARVFVVDRFPPRLGARRTMEFPEGKLGNGVLISAAEGRSSYSAELARQAREVAESIPVRVQVSRCGDATAAAAFDGDGVERLALGVPVRYSGSLVEMVDVRDLDALVQVLTGLLQAAPATN